MKDRIMSKTLVITTVICLAPILLGLAFYSRLPQEIPSHFDLEGNVNGYMNKAYMVFLMPLFMAGMNVFSHLMLEADPKRRNTAPAMRMCIKWVIPVTSCIVVPVSLLAGLGINMPVSKIVLVLLGGLFIILGNYMPKCRQSYTVGIKTPWTLNSEENWKRTHHMAGFLWITGGVVTMISAFSVNNSYISLAVLCIVAIVPMAYSYILYRKGI